MLAEPRGRAGELARRRGATTSPVARSGTTSSGPPASVVVTTGFSERNASYGTMPEVLVDRRVVDGEAARVEVGELAPRRPGPSKRTRPSRPRSRASSSSRSRSGPSPAITTSEPGIERRGLEQQVDPLRAVEPAHREDEVAVRRRSGTSSSCGGCGSTSATSPVERSSRPATLRGGREEPRRLAERDPVELLHLPAERAVLGRLAELAELGAVELVRLPELVHEPDALVRVADDVRRELRRDDEVDPPAVGLVEVEQPPEERLREHARARVPLERDRDEVGLVAARAQLVDELVGEDLGAAARERHLRPQTAIRIDASLLARGAPRARPRARSTCS